MREGIRVSSNVRCQAQRQSKSSILRCLCSSQSTKIPHHTTVLIPTVIPPQPNAIIVSPTSRNKCMSGSPQLERNPPPPYLPRSTVITNGTGQASTRRQPTPYPATLAPDYELSICKHQCRHACMHEPTTTTTCHRHAAYEVFYTAPRAQHQPIDICRPTKVFPRPRGLFPA